VVPGRPERRANALTSGDPLDREPDVDGQAYALGDRHVQGLKRKRRVNRHGTAILPNGRAITHHGSFIA
jgi:hypothetical protein